MRRNRKSLRRSEFLLFSWKTTLLHFIRDRPRGHPMEQNRTLTMFNLCAAIAFIGAVLLGMV